MEDEHDPKTSSAQSAEQNRVSSSPEASLSTQHRNILRSCLTCHQRKIRCDKRSPCSNCVRNDVLCCYPEIEQRRRRPQKVTIGEISARLARLERTITAITKGTATPDVEIVPDLAVPRSERGYPPTIVRSPAELLVRDGDTSRYINEVILSRILDEERELQAVMTNSSINDPIAEKTWSSDLGGIFQDFNRSVTDMQIYNPSRWQALQLWQTFLNNIDPIIKIIHLPTVQAAIYTAINNPSNVEHDLSALLFSIYFSATTSLSNADAFNLLGQERGTSLTRFKQGLEHSLAGANVFDSPSMRSLQAMTLYITCLRVFNPGRSVWTLAGLTIRIAQSIGLHRDGSNLHLSPFESEMRRRVWWYLRAADSRGGEDLGIAICNYDSSSDTRLPLNVNNSDLSPDMQELPAARSGWTEMTYSLVNFEIGISIHQIVQNPALSLDGSSKAQELAKFKRRLDEEYLQYGDRNIPIQRGSLLFTPVVFAKLEFVIQLQSSPSTSTNEETLIQACHLLELYLEVQADELLRGFHWQIGSYTQYHLLTYVLWYLCVRPGGPSIERAWNAIESCFRLAESRQLTTHPGTKWTILRRLRGKALSIRDMHNSRKVEENNGNPALEEVGMAFPADENGDALGETWNWGSMNDQMDFQDWNNVENFDMRLFNDL